MAGVSPVFIIGTERSGSNLLRLILNQHPSIAIPHPPHILKEMAPLEPLYGDLGQDRNFRALIADVASLVALHFAPWDVPVDEEAVFAEAPGRDVYGVKAAVYDQYRRAKGKRRWGCKSTFVVDYADRVLRRHPEAKFVHLVRDGRDVAVSAKSSVFNHFHPHYVARLWARQQRTAIELARRLSPERISTLRYEDLLEDPAKAVRRVCEFIGEDYSDALLAYPDSEEAKSLAGQSRSWENCARPVLRANRAKYRQELSGGEIRAFELQAFEELRHFGYALDNDLEGLRSDAGRGLGAATRLRYWLSERARAALETARSLVYDKNAASLLRKRLFVLGLRLSLRRRKMTRVLTAGLAALGLSAAASAAGFSPEAPCPGCSVVLVSFDTLSGGHVHALGHERPTTPAIDAFAAQGALFTQAVTPAPWTLPAHMSWFTGTYPCLHKVINKYVVAPDGLTLSNLQALSPGLRTLPEVLKESGYATGGFTGGAGVSGGFGFKQGFDVYSDDVPPFTGMEVSIPRAEKWLSGLGGKRFFLFLHGYGIHGQYLPPGGYDKRFVDPPYQGPYDGTPSQQRVLRELGLRGPIELEEADAQFWRELYDEKIARADALFAGFLAHLKKLKLDRRTVFVLASDHGEEDYEHRKFDHGHSLYDELERVLLVVVSPGVKGGQVIDAQVSTLSLLPTILGLVGIEPDPALAGQIKGRSLLPALEGRSKEGEDVYMETDYRLYTHKRGLRTRDGWKLIDSLETGKVELYNLKEDPRETKDLAGSQPKKARELKETLLAHYRSLGFDLAHFDQGCSPVYADQCH